MSDPRLTPVNARVAHGSVSHMHPDHRMVQGDWMRVIAPVADLCDAPQGACARQLVAGARFLALDQMEGHVFGQAGRDGYVGWLSADAVGPDHGVSHRVSALATHVYPTPDIKSGPVRWLPFGALLSVLSDAPVVGSTQERHAESFVALSGGGFVPRPHLNALNQPGADPVAEALRFVGVPYLWGGNSPLGIDCSGLVQAACWACGLACPGDSDMQRAALGHAVDAHSVPLRGDLIFWDGHVGLCVGPDQLLHANAHHMAVTLEGFIMVCARIVAAGGGPVRAIRRLDENAVRLAPES